MGEIDPAGTFLTERQVQILRLRERGLTQAEVAERIETTASNVSAVERNARENVEKARETLDCVRLLRTRARFRTGAGTSLDTLVGRIYDLGDEHGVKVAYRKPELYGHVHEAIEPRLRNGQTTAPVEVGLTHEGEVIVQAVGQADEA